MSKAPPAGSSPSPAPLTLRFTSSNNMRFTASLKTISWDALNNRSISRLAVPPRLYRYYTQHGKHSICLPTPVLLYSYLRCEIHSAPTALSSYTTSAPAPASTLHPQITAVASGSQAELETAMDMFCLLSNEHRNVTVGLSAGAGQPSIHTCGISTVYQAAGRQLCSPRLCLSLSPAMLVFFIIIIISVSLQLFTSMCASTKLRLITNKHRAQTALLSQPFPASTPTSLT